LAAVTLVCGVLAAPLPATAAAVRPVPSVTAATVSKSSVRVGDRVVFRVGWRNPATRASEWAPLEIRLSTTKSSRRSIVVYRGWLKGIPARSKRTYAYAATIWSTVSVGKYYVLSCRTYSGRNYCQDIGRLAVVPAPARIVLKPGSSMSFGSVTRGSTSAARRVIVRNAGQLSAGQVDLDVHGEDDDDFRVKGSSCGRSLGPGASCVVDVLFRPTALGSRKAKLKVDPDAGSSVSITLSGTGRPPADSVDDSEDEVTGDDSPGIGCTTKANATGAAPATVLNLTNWKLTLPVDGCDENTWADEVTQPQLETFRDARYFTVNSAGGVVFRARVDGARTSSNTKYPRSELREMADRGEKRASWSNKSSRDGVHRMSMSAAITAVAPNKPDVVAAQIHDESDDVIMIRLYGNQLVVDANDSKVRLVLDDDYALGERFAVSITASNGNIRVIYNGNRTVDYRFGGSGMYFKAGCYTLSNTSYDRADRFGEVVIHKLSVSHS
jgi:hypothetical protein